MTKINSNLKNFFVNLPEPLNIDTNFCMYGRNGLFQVAKKIKEISPNRNKILVPCYSCGDEIETIINAGWEPEIYKINDDLQANLDDLKNKLNENVGGVLLVHYFGFPQKQIIQIKQLTNGAGCFLIEDCAHALGGSHNSTPLGKFGDASIFSLRKFLSIPHGGAVIVNNDYLKGVKFIEPPEEANNLDMFIFLAQKYNFFKSGTPIEEIYKQCGYTNKTHHGARLEDFGGYDLGLTEIAKLYICKQDWEENSKTRKNNYISYLQMAKEINSKEFIPVFSELPEGITPLNFPVIVKDSTIFHQELKNRQWEYSVPFWSYLHKYVDWSSYPNIKKLKQQIICLPLNKKIDFDLLKQNILSIINK